MPDKNSYESPSSNRESKNEYLLRFGIDWVFDKSGNPITPTKTKHKDSIKMPEDLIDLINKPEE